MYVIFFVFDLKIPPRYIQGILWTKLAPDRHLLIVYIPHWIQLEKMQQPLSFNRFKINLEHLKWIWSKVITCFISFRKNKKKKTGHNKPLQNQPYWPATMQLWNFVSIKSIQTKYLSAPNKKLKENSSVLSPTCQLFYPLIQDISIYILSIIKSNFKCWHWQPMLNLEESRNIDKICWGNCQLAKK